MRQTWRALFSATVLARTALSSSCHKGDGYDVIVIGSGPAGLVVADRMSEAGRNTLLLEQGGPSYYVTGGRERPGWLNGTSLSRVDVPGLYKSIFSEAGQLTCASDIVNAFQGCTLGGSSAINAGLFFQPPASDWDLYFPEGWKNKDMQSAISKVRSKQPSTNNPSADGKRYLQSGYEAARHWLVDGAGYSEVGLNDGPDNHSKTKVFGHPVFNYEGGQRSGPVRTYLQSALERDNFSLRMGTRVLRIIRDGEIATGVEIEAKNGTDSICINKGGKIILSGGALLSPQLLMWSGIGDPAILANISLSGLLSTPPLDWINNTAVGDKIFDNPNTFIELYSDSVSSYEYSYTNPLPEDRDLYLASRSGPYSFGSQTSAFWDFIQQGNETVGCQGTIDSSGAIDFTENGTITLNVYGTSGLRSFGKVGLDISGIATPTGGFFYSDPRDAQAVGTFIHSIFQALPPTLRPLNIAANSTKEEIIQWVSTPSDYTLGNVQHWSSSCRFETCVDTNAKVIGMENLFVVDASISAPLTTNPVMGTMIIAERAVERILAL
ncbi:FAD/NAD(P)-binding domain-containing protein [Corynespora cassiicola Philippines]|uniref:FAD/NAD(P)-binding domain-containing protein n=1 Tax=Corynespora cassiicola Philippines TaxID=1448308 RepID=A0A2T2NMC7_CORCC|nr:FAD/NAD(P)-binding domain-containing protein [Corynespora cassiicola Philippines]